MDYKSQYRKDTTDNKMKVFRIKMFNKHHHKCQKCGKPATVLHHTFYEPEKYLHPADYPEESLMVLCQYCHALEHGILKYPNTGWELIDYWDEIGFGYTQCEFCGNDLLHCYQLRHPKAGYLVVGCCCSERLQTKESEEYLNLKSIQRFLKYQYHYQKRHLFEIAKDDGGYFVKVHALYVDKEDEIAEEIKDSSKRYDSYVKCQMAFYKNKHLFKPFFDNSLPAWRIKKWFNDKYKYLDPITIKS